jgi:hypothetical protein
MKKITAPKDKPKPAGQRKRRGDGQQSFGAAAKLMFARGSHMAHIDRVIHNLMETLDWLNLWEGNHQQEADFFDDESPNSQSSDTFSLHL